MTSPDIVDILHIKERIEEGVYGRESIPPPVGSALPSWGSDGADVLDTCVSHLPKKGLLRTNSLFGGGVESQGGLAGAGVRGVSLKCGGASLKFAARQAALSRTPAVRYSGAPSASPAAGQSASQHLASSGRAYLQRRATRASNAGQFASAAPDLRQAAVSDSMRHQNDLWRQAASAAPDVVAPTSAKRKWETVAFVTNKSGKQANSIEKPTTHAELMQEAAKLSQELLQLQHIKREIQLVTAEAESDREQLQSGLILNEQLQKQLLMRSEQLQKQLHGMRNE